MGIIDQVLTEEQKAIKTRGLINERLKGVSKALYFNACQVFDMVWNNADGLSAQQVFDSYGDEAVAFAQLFARVEPLVRLIDNDMWTLVRPGSIVPVLVDGVPNGHVVVTLNE